MACSRASSRKDFVDRSFSRIKVSLCCTSGWSTTVTPCIVVPRSKYRSVADHLQRWATVSAQFFCESSARAPRAALQNFRQRQCLTILVQARADDLGEMVEQRHGERTPFHHQFGIDAMLAKP